MKELAEETLNYIKSLIFDEIFFLNKDLKEKNFNIDPLLIKDYKNKDYLSLLKLHTQITNKEEILVRTDEKYLEQLKKIEIQNLNLRRLYQQIERRDNRIKEERNSEMLSKKRRYEEIEIVLQAEENGNCKRNGKILIKDGDNDNNEVNEI